MRSETYLKHFAKHRYPNANERTNDRARPDIRREEEEERRSYLRFEIPREIVEPACTNFAIWCPSIDSSVS